MKNFRTLAYIVFFIVVFTLGGLISLRKYHHIWHTIYCTALYQLTSWNPKVTAFRMCSNVNQKVVQELCTNLEWVEQVGQLGWFAISNADKTQPGRIRIRVFRDRDSVVFFPRLNNASSKIEIYEIRDHNRRKLFSISGNDTSWTAMGEQHSINLGCCIDGYLADVYEVDFEIILSGPWAQIWVSKDMIFY